MPPPDDFEVGDLPAALAPFEAFCPEGLNRGLRLLSEAARGSGVHFDPLEGVIVFTRGTDVHHVYPWMLLKDGSDRDAMLSPFPQECRAQVAEAVLRVWGWMAADLAGEVARERWIVLAREDRPLAPISILPAGAWAVFEVEDWERGVALCRFTSDRLFDVHFRTRSEPARTPDAEAARSKPKSDAVIRICDVVFADRAEHDQLTPKLRRQRVRDKFKTGMSMADLRLDEAIKRWRDLT